MDISKIKVGELQTNCYLLEKDTNCLLINPGDEYKKIQEFIKNKNVIGILVTHNHYDHIGCINDLVMDYDIPIYDNSSLDEGMKKLGPFNLEVIRTYGHTMDSISFYFDEDKVIFTGDFLFYDTIGRCDFIESDYNEMLKSINKIKEFSNDIIVYPGHGRETNLGREKKYNVYFK